MFIKNMGYMCSLGKFVSCSLLLLLLRHTLEALHGLVECGKPDEHLPGRMVTYQ